LPTSSDAGQLTPTSVDHVQLFDPYPAQGRPMGGASQNGKIAASAPAIGESPAGATVIDGRGKTLVPGLWIHTSTSATTEPPSNVATGIS
jgi:hypothetical protein